MGVNNANLLESIRVTKRNITLSSEAITTAQTAFTTHYNESMVLAEQLEVKFNELEVREGAVEIKEKQMKAQGDQLQAREQKCIEREQNIEKREKEVPIQEERWREIEKRMQTNAAKLPQVIHMNVSMYILPNFLTFPVSSPSPLPSLSNSTPARLILIVIFHCRWNKVLSFKREASAMEGITLRANDGF